jgi:diguanylate cyclase (GGDEF)-like protein
MDVLASLQSGSKRFWVVAGFALIGAIGILDYLTGYELAFSLFYLIPICLITWITSRRMGVIASLASASVWLTADILAGSSYSHPLILAWNTLIRLSYFVFTTLLLSSLRGALERERELAGTDYLTGAVNSRLFYELVHTEIDRLQRYSRTFTLAYIDLDDFKTLNDRFGHSVGDRVLRMVVSSAKMHLRKTDVVARLGGDEFALLLPEADQEAARVVISKVLNGLSEETGQYAWPVTCSIGVVTCGAAPPATDELVKMADELMYSVKRARKNAAAYAVYTG